jgi:hypothetical protein
MLVAYMDESGDHDPLGKERGAEAAVVAGMLRLTTNGANLSRYGIGS